MGTSGRTSQQVAVVRGLVRWTWCTVRTDAEIRVVVSDVGDVSSGMAMPMACGKLEVSAGKYSNNQHLQCTRVFSLPPNSLSLSLSSKTGYPLRPPASSFFSAFMTMMRSTLELEAWTKRARREENQDIKLFRGKERRRGEEKREGRRPHIFISPSLAPALISISLFSPSLLFHLSQEKRAS